MGLTVSELQARVSADISSAMSDFERFNNMQEKVGDTAKETANKVEQAGEQIDESAKKASVSWQKFGNEMANLGSKLRTLGLGLSVALTAPIIALGKEALQTAVRFNSLERGMKAVMHSSTLAKNEIEKLKEVAKLPGLGLEEAEQGSIRLQAAGLSAKEARDALKGFGNALATVGAGKAELSGVTLALTQISAKGKVMAQDIRQIQERVPQIKQIMIDAFGSADTEILQRANITSKEFIDAITKQLLKLPQVTGGIQNDLENLQDKWKLTLNQMGIALFPFVQMVSDQLTPAFDSITAALQAMSPGQKNFIVWVTLAVAAIGPVLVGLGLLAGAFNNLIGIFTAFGVTAETLTVTMEGLALGPIALIAGAIAGLYLAWRNNWGGMRDAMMDNISSMKQSMTRWKEFIVDTWHQWTQELDNTLSTWGSSTQDFLMRFRIFWQTFWTGIALIVTAVFGVIKDTIDIVLGAIRIAIVANLQILRGDWKGAWDTVKDTASKTWDNIKQDTTNSISSLQTQFNGYYKNVARIVEDGQKTVANIINTHPLAMGNTGLPMMVGHATTLPTIGDAKLNADYNKALKDAPDFKLPAVGVDMADASIRARVASVLNVPKKHKLTPEEKQTNSAMKELNDLKAESIALDRGASSIAADVAGKYNLVNKSIIDQITALKESNKARKDATDFAAKQARDLVTEQNNFHDFVKRLEADRRDLTASTKTNSITAEFPHASKNMVDYASALKLSNQALRDSQDENKRFNQTLAETKGQIQSLLDNDGLAALKAQYKGLVTNENLRQLADANAELKSLQELQSATDKLSILQLPTKEERQAASGVGMDLWRTMTFEARLNTVEIYKNIEAQNALTTAMKKTQEEAEKRAQTLKDFADSMQQRVLSANASLAGDSAGGAWEKLIAGNTSLRNAIGEGPTQAKADAMKEFFDAFNAEESTKKILDTTSALNKFNEQMDESITLSRLRLSNQGDTAQAAWAKFLGQKGNVSLAEKFKTDTEAATQAWIKFKENFDLDRQADTLDNFNSNMADLQKRFGILSTADPFKQFKISMMEIRNGKLMQPFTEAELHQMFNIQRLNEVAEQLQDIFQNAIGNLKNGFGSFFSSIVQGFEKMLQDMAAKWLASQLVNLVMQLIGSALGVPIGQDQQGNFKISKRAMGGPVTSGQAYLVGERGPELFIPQGNGRIDNNVPNGNHYHFNFIVQTPDANSFRQSQGQIMTDAKRQADYMERKNVSRYNRSNN